MYSYLRVHSELVVVHIKRFYLNTLYNLFRVAYFNKTNNSLERKEERKKLFRRLFEFAAGSCRGPQQSHKQAAAGSASGICSNANIAEHDGLECCWVGERDCEEFLRLYICFIIQNLKTIFREIFVYFKTILIIHT